MSETSETLGRRRGHRWWLIGTTVLALVAFAVVFAAASSADLSGSTFESTDGNLVVTTNGHTDWKNVAGLQASIDQPSGSTDNSFTQGTKEDDPSVTIEQGSIPPNKNDLTRSYLASETVGGQTFLYLAWERTDGTGSANLDFELDQQTTAGWDGSTTGPVTINRTEGDLLFTYDFGGSGTPTLGLNFWLTDGHGHSGSDCTKANSLPCWGNHITLTPSGTPAADGAVNTGDVLDDVTTPAVGTLTAGKFGEAAINLTAIPGIFSANTCKAFGSQFVKSRASGSSVDAELKDFIAPSPIHVSNCGSIELKKHWVGTAGSATLKIGTTVDGSDVASQPVSGADGTTGAKEVENGNYHVSETVTNASDYTSSLSCTDNNGAPFDPGTGNIPVSSNHTVVCTFTNAQKPHLTLQKTVVNDNGGAATASQWTLSATSGNDPNNFSGAGPTQSHVVTAGAAYALAESNGPSGYAASAWSCNGGNQSGSSITLSAGQNATCTITNNDIAPVLHLRKVVVNDNGGTKTVADFPLSADGTGANDLSGTSPVDSGSTLKADTWTLSETPQAGYAPSSWVCVGGTQSTNHITLGLGGEATCTITNNDIAPVLRLRKVVVNDNGGTKTVADFPLSADGTGANDLSGTSPVDSGSTLKADTWTLSETPQAGYAASDWVCQGGSQSTNHITVGVGGEATCTITNDDIAPKLIVIKHVINDNGGTKTAADFGITVTGSSPSPATFQGAESPGTNVAIGAGSYSVEEGAHAGYTETKSADCDSTIALGETKTCTITNDDIGPKLIVIKHVINDNGGTKTASDFTMTVTGGSPTPASFPGAESPGTQVGLAAGQYSVEEGDHTGYTETKSADCAGTIAIGDTKTCTITNDDVAPKLHLRKVVVNDNGGTKTVADFTLTADGTGSNDLSGTSPVDSGATLKADTFTLAETQLAGYTASNWVCVGGSQEGNSVTVGLGGEATCTITNDDIAPKLHLRKVVVNDNGGTKTVADFTLTAAGTEGNSLSGTSPVDSGATLRADTWTLSETQLAGYTAGSWVCVGGTQATNHITVGVGGEATCTITNDDIAPKLHLRKVVVNDDGGTKTVADFPLSADGTGANDLSGTSPVDSGSTLKADTWTLSETPQAGYTAGSWVCVGGTQAGNQITVGLGGEATCTITNNDIAAPPPPVTPPAPPAPKIDLQITKSATPNPLTVGNQVTWTMVVTNNGPSNATGVKMADPVPAGMTFVSATSTQGTCTGGVVVSCTIGNMNVGSSVTITLLTTAAATGTTTNTATTVGNEQETNTTNNTASASVVVNGVFTPPVTYCTAVAVSPKSLFVGRKNTLTMKVTSHGKAKAGVKIRIKGSTLSVTTKPSNGKGVVKQTVKPMKAGIVIFAPVAVKSCKNPRVGVIGVFTPPVTG